MSVMLTLSWIGIMMLVGVILRAVIKPLGNILMPASVIGGLIGFILMNTGTITKLGADPNLCNSIVDIFFTISFISIGLTGSQKVEGVSGGKEMLKGTFGLGFVWDLLYGLQPLVTFGALLLVGGFFSMAPEYGLLIPFAFCQGPGQSAVFGGLIEQAGWAGAQQVAITFAVLGFVWAFALGAPIAKRGLKKKMATYPTEISPAIAKGIYKPEEQKEIAGKMTTYNGNIDTLAFNLTLVGLCYVLGVGIQKLLLMVPVSLIQTMGSMTFFWGWIAAMIVRKIMEMVGVKQYHDDILQARITGFSTDFLIAAAFMAVQLSVVGQWLVPILISSTICAIVTFFVCVFFTQRYGGVYDFERLLGMWGSATGTCPSGVALIRIVDPELKTTVPSEMGSMNIMMVPAGFLASFVIEFMAGRLSFSAILIGYAICIVGSIIALLVTRTLRAKKSFDFFKGEKYLTIQDLNRED